MPAQKPELLSDRLAAAMSHPTRMHAMTMFWEREASPREIADSLDEPLNNVTYHVNQLLDLGWIELVAQRPARGGRVVEHFYKATRSSQFDSDELTDLGIKERLVVDNAIMSAISRDVSEAMISGTFFEFADNHLSRIPLMVDPEGWEEAKEILDRAFNELMTIRQTVATRTAESGEATFPTRVNIIQFKAPQRKDGGNPA